MHAFDAHFLLGNHNCVSTINTYVDRLDVVYFSEKRGLESAWSLKQILVTPVHSLITQVSNSWKNPIVAPPSPFLRSWCHLKGID